MLEQRQSARLGDRIQEERARISGIRVLSTDGDPEFEISFQGAGTIAGVEMNDLGSYRSILRPDGTFYGQGEGVVLTTDGDVVTWKANGIGRPTGDGLAVSWRGSFYYRTEADRFAHLNRIGGIAEFEVDADGAIDTTMWEWS